MNYARRQQYRRLSRAATAAVASGASVLLAVAVAAAGAVSAAGAILVLAVGPGLYARHWLSLAERSRVGARSEDAVRRALAARQAEGSRLHHSLPWRGRGDVDSLATAPGGVAFVVETKCAARRPVVSPVIREGLEGRFLGAMAYPDPTGERDSMPAKMA